MHANHTFANPPSSIGTDVTSMSMEKIWNCLQALGVIAFAYSFSNMLIEIQDTIKAPPPSEAKVHSPTAMQPYTNMYSDQENRLHNDEETVMKAAMWLSVATTTIFYMSCGCMCYAAFGDAVPRHLLSGFGFYEPYWLLHIANAALISEHALAYRIHCQELFRFVEEWARERWPESKYVTGEVPIGFGGRCYYKLNMFRVTWRTAFVVSATAVSVLPFFNDVDVLQLVGALRFWPFAVYFPVQMYIVHKKVPRWSTRWVCLQALSLGSLVITVGAMAGSVAGNHAHSNAPIAVAYRSRA